MEFEIKRIELSKNISEVNIKIVKKLFAPLLKSELIAKPIKKWFMEFVSLLDYFFLRSCM